MKNQRIKLLIFVFLFVFSVTSFSRTLKFDGVSEVMPLKRGKEYSIKWSGGAKDQAIKIELHNAAGRVQSWDETLNDGENTIKLNSRLKPGDNYSFKILMGSELVSSQNVQIRRRIPLGITISAMIIVPTVIGFVGTRNSGVGISEPPSSPRN